MSSSMAADRRGEALRLAGACLGLLACAAVLGTAVNYFRPESTRLPWVGDWEHHIETKAFRGGIPVVFLAGVRARVEDPASVIFDARAPEQYAAGHLPRALSLPVGDADRKLVAYAELLTLQTPILVYCGGADCSDSLELAVKLRELGFTAVALYPGGYAEWTEYGGEVRAETEP
jgi:rhodanese-related sulfurtransferase